MSEGVAQLHRCVEVGELTIDVLSKVMAGASSAKECEVLDFKRQLPQSDLEYAKTLRDLVAFHNSYGGFLVFGIDEPVKDRQFAVVGVEGKDINLAKLRDIGKTSLSADLRFASQQITLQGQTLEVLLVSKRSFGEQPVRFLKNGPEASPGKPCFKRNDVVFRRIDSNGVAQTADDYEFLYSQRRPPSLELSFRDTQEGVPLDHNLPDRALVCSHFVGRKEGLGDLWTWLADGFSRVRLIAGEGGLGKTSLAYHFVEEVASRRVKPFEQVVWLTAKERQFIAAEDAYRENLRTDFHDATSLFQAIAAAHGCLEKDFEGLELRELMQLTAESCQAMPSFIVVDDIDSLPQADQLRALEFGMRTPPTSKMLLTTRVNFSYSPDNVLKLNGLPLEEFEEYVTVLRTRYQLAPIKSAKVLHLSEITGGSPLFTDSLLRLERRGLSLDQAINQWKGQGGLEVRKAALAREVMHLTKPARRILYVVSHLKNVSYVELGQILDYADQTLGDALQELTALFLISAPTLAREARYTIDPNIGALVMSIAPSLGIDHTSLIGEAKRARSDAIGLGMQRRNTKVGQAIYQAIAKSKAGDAKGALAAVQAAAKSLTKPHPDLLLAVGRFSMKLTPPDIDQASKSFNMAYDLGQRKKLLFDLWFEAEARRGDLEAAQEVLTKVIADDIGDEIEWLELRAQTKVGLAYRARSNGSLDSAVREIEAAKVDLRRAVSLTASELRRCHLEMLLDEAERIRRQLNG